MATLQFLQQPLAQRLGRMQHPAELFPAFAALPYPILLDSAATHHELSRYSYVTADPFLVMRAYDQRVILEERDGRTYEAEDLFETLRALLQSYHVEPNTSQPGQPGLPPFQGGVAGYFGYDLGRLLERLPATTKTDPRIPDLVLGFYDWVIAHDNLTGETWLFSTGLPNGTTAAAGARAAEVLERIHANPLKKPAGTFSIGPFASNFTHPEYLAAVRRVKEYLAAGDVYQVNLSQRFEAAFSGDPWALYQRLRAVNPAPFAAYLQYPELTVLSASPERFLHMSGSFVETRPIKGTRPRGATPSEDERLAQELTASEKDRAENVIIVDLLRNDLGRVGKIGSIKVLRLFELEAHPTIWHLVSTVTGELASGKDITDLLRASFPGGSITGAPKIRSMQIIEELEPHRRGVYCGSIGYLSFTGDVGTSITIRTMVLVGKRLFWQVGGGIMADSDPELEYQETFHKARGMMRALGYDA